MSALHPTIAAAMAPFAPPQSAVHRICTEDSLRLLDAAYEAAKQSGAIERARFDRALDAQIELQTALDAAIAPGMSL